MSLRIGIVSYLLSPTATGLSVYTATLTARLLDSGHQVTVLTTDLEYAGGAATRTVEIDPRACLLTFPVRGAVNRRLYRCPALAAWIKHHPREFDIIDIQGIWALVNFAAARAAEQIAVPYVLTPHGMLSTWDWEKRTMFKKIVYSWRAKRMVENAGRIRFLSAGEKSRTKVTFPCLSEVIPNAVETPFCDKEEARTHLISRFGIERDTRLVVFLGRLTAQKGVVELVEGFNKGASEKKAALFLVGPLGDAAYVAKIAAEARKGVKPHSIHIVGPVYSKEKYVFLRGCDLFVTLSRNEGLPLAVLEALSEGVPLMLTTESNLPEAVEEGAAVTVRCNGTEVGRAIVKLLDDPDKLGVMAQCARAVHQVHFSWQVVLPKVIEMYQEVLKLD